MAGTLNVTTITGVSTISGVSTLNAASGVLATQNGMTGIAKAWVNFNPSSGSSATIRSSFNVSSVTYNATGSYTVNFTTAFADTNYVAVGTSSVKIGNTATIFCPNWTPPGTETASATGSFKCGVVLTTTAATDPVYVYISFFAS
jgi:hypothetical protein